MDEKRVEIKMLDTDSTLNSAFFKQLLPLYDRFHHLDRIHVALAHAWQPGIKTDAEFLQQSIWPFDIECNELKESGLSYPRNFVADSFHWFRQQFGRSVIQAIQELGVDPRYNAINLLADGRLNQPAKQDEDSFGLTQILQYYPLWQWPKEPLWLLAIYG